MAHKPRMTAGFVTVCCSMSMVSKTSCSHFSIQGSYYGYTLHTLGLNFTMKSWAESLALMSVIMHGPYLKWTQLLYVIWRYRLWAACPSLSWSAGEELDSERSIVSISRESSSMCTCPNLKCTYPFVQLKISIYSHTQTDIHMRLAMQSR